MLLDTFDGHRLSVIGRAMRGSLLIGCIDRLLRQVAKPMLHHFNTSARASSRNRGSRSAQDIDQPGAQAPRSLPHSLSASLKMRALSRRIRAKSIA
jgi:hypothetical protein